MPCCHLTRPTAGHDRDRAMSDPDRDRREVGSADATPTGVTAGQQHEQADRSAQRLVGQSG